MKDQTPRQQLEAMKHERFKRDCPSFPAAYYPKSKKPKSAGRNAESNALNKFIVDYLTEAGHWATRINNQGREIMIKGKKKWVVGTTINGTADIIACINGKFVMIEGKINDKQSDAQKDVEQAVIKSKGYYYTVHSAHEMAHLYNATLYAL